MNGYVGLLLGAGLALSLVAGASSGSSSPAPASALPAPGTPHATEEVVEGHTAYAVLEIDDAEDGG